jgi:hypothetical protein
VSESAAPLTAGYDGTMSLPDRPTIQQVRPELETRLNVASLESLRADMGFTMDTEPK